MDFSGGVITLLYSWRRTPPVDWHVVQFSSESEQQWGSAVAWITVVVIGSYTGTLLTLHRGHPLRGHQLRGLWRCGLVGIGVASMEGVCHWGWAVRFQELYPGPVTFSLPAACRAGCRTLSYLLSTTLPAMKTVDKSSETVSQPREMLHFIEMPGPCLFTALEHWQTQVPFISCPL